MDTYQEKIKKSFGVSLENKEMNSELIDFLIEKAIDSSVAFEDYGFPDLENEAKKLTNSFIEKANKLNI
ncbi:MAG: hypothetical protein M0Q53_08685 [Prolixibacteraceae bacterium]|nr:hypothetical protein [Prolixibacteraceae bacterium]